MNDSAAEFGPYTVRCYHRDPERLVIAFAGAGQKSASKKTEEFRETLWESGVSLCFVRDLEFGWYSHETARLLFDHLAHLSSTYRHVGAIGHCMGASGAILCAAHCPELERVLAFSPQFSIVDPSLHFEERFRDTGAADSGQRRVAFHAPERMGRVVVLYGIEDGADLVHAGAYAIHGYDLGFVEGANHMLPRTLNRAPEGNLLSALAARFTDFDAPFGYDAVKAVLGAKVSRHLSSRDSRSDAAHQPKRDDASGWVSRCESAAGSPRRLPAPEGLADLCIGRVTDQSSICSWSQGTTGEDSARAVSLEPTGGFSFHTAEEDRPWWSIDFGEEVVVRLVRIYNRMQGIKAAYRGVRFTIEVCERDEAWREVFRKDDRPLFGGADGDPFAWAPEDGIAARRLRIRLLGRAAMHYDRIEIFG